MREATSSNLFIVKDGLLSTHPLTKNILPGISRLTVLSLCKELELEVSEMMFPVARMLEADEVFLTGTITDVLGVVEVDGVKIGNGKVGPVARKLNQALVARAQDPPCPDKN